MFLLALLASTIAAVENTSCVYDSVAASYFVTSIRKGCAGQGEVQYRFSELAKGLHVCEIDGRLSGRLPDNWIIARRRLDAPECRIGLLEFPSWTVTKIDVRQGPVWVCPNSGVPAGFYVSPERKAGICGKDTAVLLRPDHRPPTQPFQHRSNQGVTVRMNANPDGTYTTESGTIISLPPP